MKKIKLLLFTLLFISLLAVTRSVNAETEATETTTTSTGESVTWSYTLNADDKIENLVCTNIDSITGIVTIPETLDGKTVIALGKKAFYECSGMTGINFNASLISIGDNAFYKCSGIESLDFSSTKVSSIGEKAFFQCTGIESLNLGTTVEIIGKNAFTNMAIKTLNIPNSVTSLGEGAFSDCSKITSLTISESITNIPNNCFSDCKSLTEVIIPKSVTTISGMYYYTGAFYNCNSLKKILIPNTVVSIEKAFCTNFSNDIIEGLIIYGEKDSEAEKYAKENGILFELAENWDNDGKDITAPKTSKINLKNVKEYWNTTIKEFRIPAELEIIYEVSFSENVVGTQIPTLTIKIGEGENIELKNGIISGKDIIYKYTVKDTDSGLISVVSLEGGNLTDESGNKAEVVLPEEIVTEGGILSSNRAVVAENVPEQEPGGEQGGNLDGEDKKDPTTTPDDEDKKNPTTTPDNEDKKDPTTAPDTKLPQTGENMVVIATIIVASGIMAVLFVKNRKYRDIK